MHDAIDRLPLQVAASSSSPSVSIIIPSCNRAHLLPRAVASVLSQTVTDVEVIVCVDGSTDCTNEWLERATDDRIRWFWQPNRGVAQARNSALDRARGEWVAFLDDDNEWMPEYLERQLATVRQEAANVVCCLGADEQPDGTYLGQSRPPSKDPLDNAVQGWYPLTSALVARRSVLERLGGFSTSLRHFEDWHLWLRLAMSEQWAFTAQHLVLRPLHRGHRLSDKAHDGQIAMGALVRDLGRPLRDRIGWRAYERWFRRNAGRHILDVMEQRATLLGRRTGWNALVELMPHLPWSASSMRRPITMLIFGPAGYQNANAAYGRMRSTLTDRS